MPQFVEFIQLMFKNFQCTYSNTLRSSPLSLSLSLSLSKSNITFSVFLFSHPIRNDKFKAEERNPKQFERLIDLSFTKKLISTFQKQFLKLEESHPTCSTKSPTQVSVHHTYTCSVAQVPIHVASRRYLYMQRRASTYTCSVAQVPRYSPFLTSLTYIVRATKAQQLWLISVTWWLLYLSHIWPFTPFKINPTEKNCPSISDQRLCSTSFESKIHFKSKIKLK